jgi:hypothetical protein
MTSFITKLRSKNLWFSTDLSPDFVIRESICMRVCALRLTEEEIVQQVTTEKPLTEKTLPSYRQIQRRECHLFFARPKLDLCDSSKFLKKKVCHHISSNQLS